MYRRNVDERLRKIERDWLAQGGGAGDYCKYVNELRRAAVLPPDLPAGEAFGSFPSAIHSAPRRLDDFPRKWLNEAFSGWNEGLPGDQDDRRKERRALITTCLPPRGIISYLLQVIQPYLSRVSPRRCTCGGYERGHSPDCEISVGTGDPSEDLYDVMREWTSDLRGPGRENLLDMFLDGGAEAVYRGLTENEYDLYQIVTIINQRLYPILHLALDYTDGTFNFLLNVLDMTEVVRPIAGFRMRISEKNECQMIWDTELHTPTYGVRGSRFHQSAMAESLSREMVEAMRGIPMLIREYPIWNWRPLNR